MSTEGKGSMESCEQEAQEACAVGGDQPQACCCCCSGKRKMVLLVLLLIAVLLMVGFQIVKYHWGGKLRASEVYQTAMEKVREFPALKDALGEPINDSWRTAGELESLWFEVSGPKGKAKVEARGRLIQGKWELVGLDVTIESSGKRMEIPLEGDAPLANYGTPAPPTQTQAGAAKPDAAQAPKSDAAGPQIELPAPQVDLAPPPP
jgi:hypothetical protein